MYSHLLYIDQYKAGYLFLCHCGTDTVQVQEMVRLNNSSWFSALKEYMKCIFYAQSPPNPPKKTTLTGRKFTSTSKNPL